MKQTFAYAPSPLLVGVVREETPRACMAAIKNCALHGATAIDLHLSCLQEPYKTEAVLREILACCDLPVLSLNYNQRYDYSSFDTDEESRVELLRRSARAGVTAVDVQGYTFDKASKEAYHGDTDSSFGALMPKEVVTDPSVIGQQMELYEELRSYGAEILLSTHTGVYLNTRQAVDLALFLEQRGPDIIKLVAPCLNEDQLAEAFTTMVTLKKEVKTKVHFHLSGPYGKLSRIINPLLGGHLIFCSDGYTPGSNFEQLDLTTAASAVKALQACMR